mmetsp:Transcript_52254/g.93097  ORF Transcript_52254/g.93097 Transcript_52254/m.93097 type:complete len:211 (+) Transcript_52254:879-1511(+)
MATKSRWRPRIRIRHRPTCRLLRHRAVAGPSLRSGLIHAARAHARTRAHASSRCIGRHALSMMRSEGRPVEILQTRHLRYCTHDTHGWVEAQHLHCRNWVFCQCPGTSVSTSCHVGCRSCTAIVAIAWRCLHPDVALYDPVGASGTGSYVDHTNILATAVASTTPTAFVAASARIGTTTFLTAVSRIGGLIRTILAAALSVLALSHLIAH